jgi:hypothetical protein
MTWQHFAAALAAWAGLGLCGPTHAMESGTALKSDDIKAEPFRDAKTVGRIQKDDKVNIVSRRSGWLQVRTGKAAGWVRMLSIRRGAAGKADVGQEIGGVAGLATGRAGTGQVVSSTGVRGLSEEELKEAKFSEAEIAKAESYATSATAAKSFAAQARLAATQVAFLPDPKGGRK